MIRLQKYLALCGVASRRASEKMIQEGRVAVNGSVITEMGVQVDETRDTVTVDGEIVRPEEEKHYIARTYLTLFDERGAAPPHQRRRHDEPGSPSQP